MGVVPEKLNERIQFFKSHVAPWTTNAVAIGTTITAVNDLDAKVDAAIAAVDAANAARDAAKSATATQQMAVDAMANAGAAIIEQVRTKARSVGDAVYPLANLPTPGTPVPVGAPGVPFGFKAELKGIGSVELAWKCTNPPGCNGVIYQLYRRVDSTGEYHYIGGAGQRKFVDTTLPAGAASVTYMVQGTRSTSVGDAAQYTVNLGVAAAGTTSNIGTETSKGTPAKIAA
jgi:hypothetical protein